MRHGLAECFAEHRDQRWAVGDGSALKSSGDNGGRYEAQCDRDRRSQRAFGAGEHAGEWGGFHDVFPLVGDIAQVR